MYAKQLLALTNNLCLLNVFLFSKEFCLAIVVALTIYEIFRSNKSKLNRSVWQVGRSQSAESPMCSPSQLPQIHSIQFRTLAIQVNLQVKSWTRLKVSLGHLSHWLLYIVKYFGKYFPSRGNGISHNLPLIGFHGHWTWKTLTILGTMFPRSSQKLKIAFGKVWNNQKQI